MRLKAVELSNWLREKTGFSLIETEGLTPLFPNQPNVVHIVPPALPRPRPHDIPVEIVYGGMSVPVAVARPPFRHREWRPTNFAGRLHKALVTLGPWEGRAVAFVLGDSLPRDTMFIILTSACRLRHWFTPQDVVGFARCNI